MSVLRNKKGERTVDIRRALGWNESTIRDSETIIKTPWKVRHL